jgi:thiol:disulfide interchange protein DsbC
MKRISLLIIGCLIVLLPFSSHAFKLKQGQDCLDCHKLKTKDAEKIIEKAVPGGKIMGIKSSPMKGVWEIDVQRGNQRGAVLLDFSKKYLIGQLVPVDKLGEQPPIHVDFSKIPLADAVVVGATSAKKKVIVFTDPDCPYCRELHPVMKAIVEKHHDIAFYLILNPLAIHKGAYKKAQAILCAKSTSLLDDAFSGKPVPEPSCSADAVERTTALAKSLDFSGTPTLVRADGTVHSGYLPEEQLLKWIEKK